MPFLGLGKSKEKIIDASIKGIDALILTKEERLAYNKATADALAEMTKVDLQNNTVSSIARRVIAFVITIIWTIFILINLVCFFIEKDITGLDYLFKEINIAFFIVLTFYFGKYTLDSFRQKK